MANIIHWPVHQLDGRRESIHIMFKVGSNSSREHLSQTNRVEFVLTAFGGWGGETTMQKVSTSLLFSPRVSPLKKNLLSCLALMSQSQPGHGWGDFKPARYTFFFHLHKPVCIYTYSSSLNTCTVCRSSHHYMHNAYLKCTCI